LDATFVPDRCWFCWVNLQSPRADSDC
jgi:hypothetical protein